MVNFVLIGVLTRTYTFLHDYLILLLHVEIIMGQKVSKLKQLFCTHYNTMYVPQNIEKIWIEKMTDETNKQMNE